MSIGPPCPAPSPIRVPVQVPIKVPVEVPVLPGWVLPTLAIVTIACLLAGVWLGTAVRTGRAKAPDGAPPSGQPADLSLVEGLISSYDLADGNGAVQVQIERTLIAAGVRRIVVAEGESFDPASHQAVGTEAARPGPPGTVARPVRSGWRSGPLVLRPAEVVVHPG